MLGRPSTDSADGVVGGAWTGDAVAVAAVVVGIGVLRLRPGRRSR
ncbi:hypothetical protein TUE45_pSRTUE45c_0083 (plasmid) [Streptomyces reticuli]|nr:hypothetical protein TUE45_pSRTUE45c_0083 [Streptomyces reticuli]